MNIIMRSKKDGTMRWPKVREVKEAIKALLTKPFTTAFPYKEHIPYPSFRGKPEFYEDKCVGCCACVNVCPTGALSFEDRKVGDSYKRILKINWAICIECGQCQLHCLTKEGIKLSREYDLATLGERDSLYQTIEKELLVCEICGRAVATPEHMQWTIEKLGHLYVSNTALISFHQQLLGLKVSLPKEEGILRSDRFRILCPACRREVVSIS